MDPIHFRSFTMLVSAGLSMVSLLIHRLTERFELRRQQATTTSRQSRRNNGRPDSP